MQVIYDNGMSANQVLDIPQCSFYHDIADKLAKEEQKRNGYVCIHSNDGTVKYKISERSGTQCINQTANSMPDSYINWESMKPAYLTCVKEEKNSYKFYKLIPEGDKIKASWGRMGTEKGDLFSERSCLYEPSMYWVKYFEKIGKGYIDQSELYFENKESSPQVKVVQEKIKTRIKNASTILFDTLRKFSKHAVEQAKVNVPITSAIIQRSEEYIDAMRKAGSVDQFNELLKQNISILQRPVRTGDGKGVYELLAKSKSDFQRIIDRENDLLDAMKGVYYGKSADTSETGGFDDYGIEVYQATDKQKEDVLSHLSPQLKRNVKNVYRVIPKKQQDKFDAYIKENHITTVKQLWHGSRNENWLSIVINSLQLKPNAVITGKMFGDGIYFAPSSMKSWGYTSNGKWVLTGTSRRRSSTCIMGLYAVAYGKPLDVSSSSRYTQDILKNKGKNCVHAHKGSELLADEIVFFDEAAMVLNYVVEFSC